MSLTASQNGPLSGTIGVPGDKSISHRALLLGALAEGTTEVTGLLEAQDVMRTAAALRAVGIGIERWRGRYAVTGGRWRSPERILFMGNAGTGARLFLGAAAGRRIACRMDGDPSLRQRPMERVAAPLRAMGAGLDTRDGLMPVTLRARTLTGTEYVLPQPSAQVKSALLLAGLGATGRTSVVEPVPTRDHTEKMLAAFGAPPTIEDREAGGRCVSIEGGAPLSATGVAVPGDPSSAAFPLVAALIAGDSALVIENVMTNPRRTGLLSVLERMGARIERKNARSVGGEEAADIHVAAGPLRGVDVSPAAVPDMIDEIPVLAVAAAFATGTTRIEGLEELRVKESDRLASTLALLDANGVTARAGEDWMEIEGTGGAVRGGGRVGTMHDHRIAMSALVLGTASETPVTIDDASPIDTSFPGFTGLMNGIGARIG